MSYETDFYSWTQEQAALLKAGRLSEIDIDNIVEEIETMGRSEKNAFKSHLRVLLVHLLKWQYQPDKRVNSNSWLHTLATQRIETRDVIAENPGLKPTIEEVIGKAYQLARHDASKETHLPVKVFPEVCPWDFDQIVDDLFLPDLR